MQGADEAVPPTAAVVQVEPASIIAVKAIASGTPHGVFASILPVGIFFKNRSLFTFDQKRSMAWKLNAEDGSTAEPL